MASDAKHLVLYDATCGLCDRTIQWLLKHDKSGVLTFAPLDGTTATQMRKDFYEIPFDIDSIIFVDEKNGKRTAYWRSQAIMRICAYLPAPQRWLSYFRFVPTPLSDAVYRFVAHNRFRIWGRVTQCRIPTPEERLRFLP